MIDSISRRAVLRAGATAAAIGGLVAASDERTASAMLPPGQARTFDLDGNGDRNQQFVGADDPAGGTGQVLHATTDGVATTDYAASVANVSSEQLTLGDLAAEGIAYDYYVADGETGMAPDEVVLVVHTKGSDGGRHVVFRTEDDTRARDGGEWRTREVTGELAGTSSLPGLDQQWKEFHPDGRRVERIGRNLIDHFGEDATVKGAGVGKGTPSTGASTSDTYVDRFTVAGTVYDLPTTGDAGTGGDSGSGNGRGNG